MAYKFLFCFSLLLMGNILFAQNSPKKSLNINRTDTPPKIDGIFNDRAWENVEAASNFIEFRPNIGTMATYEERTEVKMTYDDEAIYIAAYLYDNPALIMKQLTNRDVFGQADFFLVVLNPNNDAQNDTAFFVFSSGVQADAIVNPTIGDDFSWNDVWDSAVKINEDGWTVEMKIPYRTLRFAEQENPIWGLQFHREFRRNRVRHTWNAVNPTQGYIGLYHGVLTGLENLKPPVRLNLYPFATGIGSSFDGTNKTKLTFGMDLKYGITDNFTLDATLVPDFSQAGFDNIVLNLGPFEQTFAEQRQFFTEGVDLFSKGGLFFSRRVGNRPSGNLLLQENETALVPNEVKVINALKISGRTKKGLGVGLFNAITEKTFATITKTEAVRDSNNNVIDTLVTQRQEVVEPFSNYNILVVDQQFNNNSAVSLINTNVLREGPFRDANATALVANIVNKKNTYRVDGELRMSHVNYQNTASKTGFSSDFFAGKIHGNLRYSLDHSFADTKYEINDLGLLFRNNFNNFGADISYQIFEPERNLNDYRVNAWVNYNNLASPNTFTGFNFGARYVATSRQLNTYGFNFRVEPGKQYDYFESRDGRPFIYENIIGIGSFYSSNYNKIFALDLNGGLFKIFEDGRDLFGYNFEINPRVRVNDNFLLIYSYEFSMSNGERGYATEFNNAPIFGERNRQIITNTLRANYTFNPFNSISLTFRHYWDTVDYDYDLFLLTNSGRLSTQPSINLDTVGTNPNINFSTWNLDFSYSWQFAPGSFLTALYRNQLFNEDDFSEIAFSSSMKGLFEQPIQHTLSVRLQFFIDYNGIKSVFKKTGTS